MDPSVESWTFFTLEMDSSINRKELASSQVYSHIQMQIQSIQSLVVPTSIFHARLLRDVKNMKRAIYQEESTLDMVLLAARLNEIGYRLHLRSALGGGDGISAFHNLRNEFLIVAGEGEAEGIDFIVEVRFKEHFEIPCPTDRYAAILQSVPEEIVTSAANLTPLVHLLSSELSIAFNMKELSLPPWRQAKSLLSKWLPSKSKDVDMSTPSGSPRAGSPSIYGASSPSSLCSHGRLTPRALTLMTPRTSIDTTATSNGVVTTGKETTPLAEKDQYYNSNTNTTNTNAMLSSPFLQESSLRPILSSHPVKALKSEERSPSTPLGGKPRSLLSADLQAKSNTSTNMSTNSTATISSILGSNGIVLTESKNLNTMINNGNTTAHRLSKTSSDGIATTTTTKVNMNTWEDESVPPIRRVRMQGSNTIGNTNGAQQHVVAM